MLNRNLQVEEGDHRHQRAQRQDHSYHERCAPAQSDQQHHEHQCNTHQQIFTHALQPISGVASLIKTGLDAHAIGSGGAIGLEEGIERRTVAVHLIARLHLGCDQHRALAVGE